MRFSRMGFIVLAVLGFTLGGAYNLRAYEEEMIGEGEGDATKDQCYRKLSEVPGTCSRCDAEACAAGTYCCKIVRLD